MSQKMNMIQTEMRIGDPAGLDNQKLRRPQAVPSDENLNWISCTGIAACFAEPPG
jgi:hypothetical protein